MAYDKTALFDKLTRVLLETPSIRLENLCTELKVERHTVRAIVHLLEGMSFRDYQKKILVQIAMDLLKEPGASVKQVASRLGYQSQSAFTRFIRSRTGSTPSQWRKCRRVVKGGAENALLSTLT